MVRFILMFFGAHIGPNTKFVNKPLILGYLNKINIGESCYFDKNIKIVVNKEGQLSIGKRTLISSNVNINAGKGKIHIGSNTMIAANVFIINNDHDIYNTLSVRDSGHITEDVFIGDNVWIGANCIVLKGVTIGEGAIIGAGAVVTRDLAPYTVNIGNPCKKAKNRYTKEVLYKKLMESNYPKNNIEALISDY
jgi:acetyltransferase-like isoleucine patch superfamily enzyme